MDAKYKKTYGRKTRPCRARQLSGMFDKVSEDVENGKPHSERATGTFTFPGPRRALKNKNLNSGDAGVNKEEKHKRGFPESRAYSEDQPVSPTYLALFESVTLDESSPKRAKPTKVHTKGSKTGSKKTAMKFLPAEDAGYWQTRVNTSATDYPSIEHPRDHRLSGSSEWNFVYEGRESFNSRFSASNSLVERPSPVDKSQGKRLLPFSQPWTASGVNKRSFVKICSATVTSEQDLQSEPTIEDTAIGGSESNSFSSVYSWITATATNTGSTSAGEGVIKEGTDDSPTLRLRPPARERFHSTALNPYQDLQQLEQTPQVSPIRFLSDNDAVRQTPSVPTQNLSPRGPRKTHSFIHVAERSAPPKCSTMLFSSPMASAGDAPMDVSSIRMALSEAMDLHDHDLTLTEKMADCDMNGQTNERVLTSTPYGQRHQFRWNMSSVQVSMEEEDELLLLHTSSDTVNSQEIMAQTLVDNTLNMSLDPESAGKGERAEPMVDALGDSGSRDESGVVLETGERNSLEDLKSGSIDKLDGTGDLRAAKKSFSQRNEADTWATPQKRVARTALLNKSEQVGDFPATASEKASQLGCNPAGYRDSSEIELDAAKDNQSLPGSDVDMPEVEDSADASSPQLQQGKAPLSQNAESRPGDGGVDMEPCPVSTLGYGQDAQFLPPTPKPRLLMCMDPCDSGFMETVGNTPPDIIGLASAPAKNL